MKSSEEDSVRLTIFVPKETDLLLRTHLAQTGMRIAADPSAVPGFSASVKWETDHLSLWQTGLQGKAFLFPGTGSLAWSGRRNSFRPMPVLG